MVMNGVSPCVPSHLKHASNAAAFFFLLEKGSKEGGQHRADVSPKAVDKKIFRFLPNAQLRFPRRKAGIRFSSHLSLKIPICSIFVVSALSHPLAIAHLSVGNNDSNRNEAQRQQLDGLQYPRMRLSSLCTS